MIEDTNKQPFTSNGLRIVTRSKTPGEIPAPTPDWLKRKRYRASRLHRLYHTPLKKN